MQNMSQECRGPFFGFQSQAVTEQNTVILSEAYIPSHQALRHGVDTKDTDRSTYAYTNLASWRIPRKQAGMELTLMFALLWKSFNQLNLSWNQHICNLKNACSALKNKL